MVVVVVEIGLGVVEVLGVMVEEIMVLVVVVVVNVSLFRSTGGSPVRDMLALLLATVGW